MFLELDDILSINIFSFFLANNVEALIYEETMGRKNASEWFVLSPRESGC